MGSVPSALHWAITGRPVGAERLRKFFEFALANAGREYIGNHGFDSHLPRQSWGRSLADLVADAKVKQKLRRMPMELHHLQVRGRGCNSRLRHSITAQ